MWGCARGARRRPRRPRDERRARTVGWGGGRAAGRTREATTTAAHPPERRELLHSAACPRAPNPHGAGAGGSTQRPTAPPKRGAARRGPQPRIAGPARTGFGMDTGNDPSAGSPTETLLRLLLPLNDKVRETFPRKAGNRRSKSPNSSPDHSIGRSDGRCVQRAGT